MRPADLLRKHGLKPKKEWGQNFLGDEHILNYVTDFLQLAHAADERYTARDGINVARFAIKLKNLATQKIHEREALETAILEVLGEEALRYARKDRPSHL